MPFAEDQDMIAWCPAWHDVRSTPKADITFQPNICRDVPEADMTTNLPNVRFGLESGRGSK